MADGIRGSLMPFRAVSACRPLSSPGFRRHSPRVGSALAILFIGASILGTGVVTPAGAGAASTPKPKPTTPTSKPLSVIPRVRAGQPVVTPGHSATKGPIGVNPATAQGVKLTILSGLLNGEPIYNGELRGPLCPVRRGHGLRLRVRHRHDPWSRREGGTHPGHRHYPFHRLRRALPGRRAAHTARVDRVGVPVGALGVGAPPMGPT